MKLDPRARFLSASFPFYPRELKRVYPFCNGTLESQSFSAVAHWLNKHNLIASSIVSITILILIAIFISLSTRKRRLEIEFLSSKLYLCLVFLIYFLNAVAQVSTRTTCIFRIYFAPRSVKAEIRSRRIYTRSRTIRLI